MNCEFFPTTEPDERGRRRYECRRPGCTRRAHTHHPPERIYASCTGAGARELRLGDAVEQMLTRIGITQERYVGWKVRLGGRPECGCKASREWLNSIRWLNNVTSQGWWLRKARQAIHPVEVVLQWLP